MKSYMGEDGRWHHRLRQSWLNTADTCPERARLEHHDHLADDETCAASVGTAVHAGIEAALNGADRDAAVELAHASFSNAKTLPGFRFVKFTERSARKHLDACMAAWWNLVRPTLPSPTHVEEHFRVPLHEDTERVIELSGTIDYVGGGLVRDWKTTTREYQEWEYRRWAIQPSVYTFAAQHLGLIEDAEQGVNFEYVIMNGAGVQRFTVWRDPTHWSWLADKARSLCLLIEAELPTWPKQDNHALCSAKWCPAWDHCKGAHGIDI